MAIDPLQRAAVPAPSGRPASARKESAGRADFDALLGAVGEPATAEATSRQAAAELLRIRMMQSSLALLAESAPPAPSGAGAVRSLIASLAADGVPEEPPAAKGATPEGFSGTPTSEAAGGNVEPDLLGHTAARYLGTPYRFGGEGASGIDCSSFVQQVFREHHVDLPRTAREQIQVGTDVPLEELKKGDLVFFQTYASYPSHVGIYLGGGKMIHASSGKGEVTISAIDSDYYRPRYLGAKRVA